MYVKTTYAGAFMAVSIMLDAGHGEEIRERFTKEDRKKTIHFGWYWQLEKFWRTEGLMYSIQEPQIFMRLHTKKQWKRMRPGGLFCFHTPQFVSD